MGTSALNSVQITNLNATPVVIGSTGQNAVGNLRVVTGSVTAVSADDTSSVYKMVRVPTTAKIKKVEIMSRIQTAGSGDINVAYSNSTTDGTQPDNQGDIIQISAANNKMFGAAQSLVLAGAPTDFTFKNATNFPQADRELPLWEALGLTSDPGGFFDIQINITTAVTTGGEVSMAVYFVE
tara:strand:+ start:567 stop:1109 length:543 start_codon:yes stop_codon:yes gene_type:complete